MDRQIAAVGDSHSFRCFENHRLIADSLAYADVNILDGKTAYKVKDHDDRVRRVIAPLKNKHLIFSFGEVDVRIHLRYQHEKSGRPLTTLLEETARRYISYVSLLRRQGYDIHVFNVVPTGDYHGPQFEAWRRGLVYPFKTGFAERQSYTLQLNECYRRHCQKLQVPFIDIYRHLIDARGRRKKELIYDFSHLNAKTADILLEHYRFEK